MGGSISHKLLLVPSLRWRALAATTLLTAVLLYAALLRLDALFKSYGPYQSPEWVAAMQPFVRSAAATLTPNWRWPRTTPYVGADPINYLKFAREMENFYAAHVREPMFPAVTRIGLTLTGDADVGISITTIACALLALVATFALGSSIASPMVGIAAAAMLAIDHTAVIHSIEGWRDELFAVFAIACAWAWLRLGRHPATANAIIAGLLSGAACLTRITSISFIAPAVLWLLATRGRAIRRELAIAVGTMTVLVAPFLVNCAIATGDPLYAINNHTEFYLKREGAADTRPISAVKYSLEKFESRPIAAADNAVTGVFVYPFTNKWRGIDLWYPGVGTVLSYLAVAGLIAWLWLPEGRLMLVMLFGALVPFSMTWTVIGGAEWRLTLFAYAFYLIAAFWILERAVRFARVRLLNRNTEPQSRRPVLTGHIAVMLAIVVAALAWWIALPYAVVRETLASGEAVMIVAGPRDRWFFADGWSHLVVAGNVTSRFAVDSTSSVRLVLPELRSYELTLRLDPVDPAATPGQTVHLSLNGRPFQNFTLGWDPARVGLYQATIPAGLITPGTQHLGLRSEAPFKLWYLRIVPQ